MTIVASATFVRRPMCRRCAAIGATERSTQARSSAFCVTPQRFAAAERREVRAASPVKLAVALVRRQPPGGRRRGR